MDTTKIINRIVKDLDLMKLRCEALEKERDELLRERNALRAKSILRRIGRRPR